MGRIRGRSGPRITARWNPSDWKDYYDQIVLLSVNGVSNIKIAERFELTPQQISNIINCDKGKEVAGEFGRKQLELMKENITGRLERLSVTALDTAEVVLTEKLEQMKNDSPIALLKVSMDILKSTGKVRDDKGNGGSNVTVNQNNITLNQQNNNYTVPIDIASRVNAGLDKLARIEEIHGKNIVNANT